MVFPPVMWELDIKKAEHQRIDVSGLWGWGTFLRVPWTARRSNKSVPKEINPEYSLEELMLKLELQYFGHLMQRTTHWKRPWCWERLRAGGKGSDRGWFGWTASPPTQWSWVWANSRRQWRTGKPGMLQSTGSQTVGHDFSNWTVATTKRKEAVTLSPFLMVLTCSLLIAFFAASPSRRWKTRSCSLVIKTCHS